MKDDLLKQVGELSPEDQIALVESIWDRIASNNEAPLPTESQKAELDRLLAAHEANPDDVFTWEEVEAAALARMRR